MKNKKLNLLIVLQVLYMYMFFGNGVGRLYVLVGGLGYLVWGLIAVISLIVSIMYFFKKDKKVGANFAVISLLEIIFAISIFLLPYMIGMPSSF